MPNKPSEELLLTAFNTVRDAWPELIAESMAHVFGEHKTLEIGPHAVPYVTPQSVQESTYIRVLFAKDAISTGWDCPRAEVLMSFRPAQDKTHITQLLGRMVRAPLARRIPGDDRLNSVECVLPHFDRATATTVGEILLGRREDGGDSGGGEGRRALIAPLDMQVNPAIPECVWEALDGLPSHTLPRRTARPVKRLAALGLALSRDGLLENGHKKAYEEMCDVLDGLAARHKQKIEEIEYGILEVEGETIVMGVREPAKAYDTEQFIEVADERTVDAEYKAATRVLTPELARQWSDRIAVADEDDDGLYDAHIRVGALARVEGIAEELDREAGKLADKWLGDYRVAIKGLSDERRAAYDDIIAMSTGPQRIDILRPRIRAEETQDGEGKKLDVAPGHLMSDENGDFPVGGLNVWERKVLERESDRPDFLAWYRNPSRPSPDALAVAYQNGHEIWRRMCPDFIFFHGDNENVKVSIVDPHGHHLGDSLPKLRGLASFAETYADEFHRMEAVAEVEGALRVLDVTQAKVRAAIYEAEDTAALYSSDAAADY
jgi:hypothetical protein